VHEGSRGSGWQERELQERTQRRAHKVVHNQACVCPRVIVITI